MMYNFKYKWLKAIFQFNKNACQYIWLYRFEPYFKRYISIYEIKYQMYLSLT